MSAPPATRRRSTGLLRLAASFVLASALARPGLAELRIGAASSLREPLGAIALLFAQQPGATPVAIAYGASSSLAAQIRAGAPLDLILCADERIAVELAAEGIAEAPVRFAGNRLVIVASRDLTLPIFSAQDLARPEIRRIAIPEYAVPVGRYARSWLRLHGLAETLEARIVRTEHARATLAVVDQGHAELAIVYASDARLARSARIVFEIPASEQPRIAYAASVLRGPRAALAHAFVSFLLERDAQAELARAGLEPPPPADSP